MMYYHFQANLATYPALFVQDDESVDWDRVHEFMLMGVDVSGWVPLQLTVLDKGEESCFQKEENIGYIPDIVDLNCTGRVLVSLRLKVLLEKILNESVQYLPNLYGTHEFYLLHVKKEVDAFIEQKSAVKRFKDGSIMGISEYCFDASKIEGCFIFRDIRCREDIFVSEEFISILNDNGMEGWEARRVGTINASLPRPPSGDNPDDE